ncbi:hypothetical protein [Flavobacterium luteolum]|uniref:hypothetical protein n=1 Tax=Flavobacterium luteolum TaxID=3003259 RepID=UPI00248E95DE|nr:hypothetical protein [Flavobacterium luteolum]
MKNLPFLFIALMVLGCKTGNIPSSPVIQDNSEKSAEEYPLKEITELLKLEYAKAMRRLEREGIKNIEISSAELTFTVTNKTKVAGNVAVLIFAGSGSKETTNSFGYTFIMKKPEAKNAPPSIGKSASHLSDAIIGAAEKFENDLKEFADLKKESFTIDITYSITVEGDGSLTFNIWKIGAGIGVTKNNEVMHEMKLEFKQKEESTADIDKSLSFQSDIQKDIDTIKSDIASIKKQIINKK